MEEPLDWLPMAPEIEDPEEPGWGQLEVRERQGGASKIMMWERRGRRTLSVRRAVEHAVDFLTVRF